MTDLDSVSNSETAEQSSSGTVSQVECVEPLVGTKAYYSGEGISLYLGDSTEVLKAFGGFDLVFMDPPFNIGQSYNGYKDKRDDFEEFIFTLVERCWNCCAGTMVLYGPDALAKIYLRAERELSLPMSAWCNWMYNFGQCHRHNWIDARCHLLIYQKEGGKWNPESVLVESERSRMGDPRVNDYANGGRRVPGTVWGIPSDGPHWGRVPGNSKERRKNHPNQLPEKLLERVVRAYTNEGDWVLDPCAGSGTTAIVSAALNRYCATVDISKENLDSIIERIGIGSVRCKR